MTHRELLSRFSGLRALVLGDAILDEYVSGACARLSPEAPVPVVHVAGRRYVLGGAANTAANIASLGGQVRLVSLVGQDREGEELAACAARAGIELTAIHDGRATSRKTRVIGERQQLVRLDYEDTHPIGPETEDQLLALLSVQIAASAIVVVSDYAKGCVTKRVAAQVIAEGHRLGKEIIVDPRPEHASFYQFSDYVTPNWREAQALLGWPDEAQSPDRVSDAGRSLATKFHSNVLLTLGAKGMAFFSRDGGERIDMPTVAKEVFDVSGAGDAVVAAFTLARAAQATNAEAMDLANRAAGIVVGKFGTATVSADELLKDDQQPSRLVSRAELAPLAEGLRRHGRRITTVNGSFDLLHVGHLHLLREASQLGDVLIVGLNSDASVRGYKGAGRPLIPQEQRAEMLMAVRYVDFVHIFDEPVPMPFLEEIRPDVHVNGSEYGSECIEAPVVTRHGGRVHIVDLAPGFSTSRLLSSLQDAAGKGAGAQ